MSNYNADSIKHLEIREAIRTRVSMYLGTDDTEGIYQALKEIINNSTDEAIAGYGNKIEITFNSANNTIQVRDFGRGIPFSTKNGKNVLVSIFTEAHTGGKFDKNAYKNSSGLNGIGGTAVCMSSSKFNVQSSRDGYFASAFFEEGILKEYTEDKWTFADTPTGTIITFTPDPKVFINDTEGFSFKRICNEIKNIAYLNKGIHFTLKETQSGEEIEYYSENGIADFINEKAKHPLMSKPIFATAKDDLDEVEIAFIWTKDETQDYVFVNGLFCAEGGSPVTGAKAKITTKIKSLSGRNFSPDLIRKGLIFAINCKVTNPSFANQTKSKINNVNLRTLAAQAFDEGLEEFSRTSDFPAIMEMMRISEKAEQAADRAREAILNKNKEIEKETKKKGVMVEKLKDCQIHDENSCLYITEGDSALGSIVASRDSTYVAAMPIRGKIINAFKHPIEEVLENEEVKDIIKACGCGIFDKFNIKKLRYGKICFAADADPDGSAIICLLLCLFKVLMPNLIKEGKVYWAQFPLYEITHNGKVEFAYNDEERDKILKKYPNSRSDRNKGLGEMNPDAFAEAAFGPNAKLLQFTIEDVKGAEEMLEILLGKRNEERTKYIFENVDFNEVEGE